MTNNLKDKLVKLQKNGSPQEKSLSNMLLQAKQTFNKLDDISKEFGCSNSSVTRFIQKLKMPSFKHFIFELNQKNDGSITLNQNSIEFDQYSEAAKRIVSLIKGNVFLFSSRRGKAMAKFFNERLNDIHKKNKLFHETWKKSLEEFAKEVSCKDTVIIITLNGESKLAYDAFKILNKKRIIILTVLENKKITNSNHFSLFSMDGIKYNLDEFEDYNNASLRMTAFIVTILNEINAKK